MIKSSEDVSVFDVPCNRGKRVKMENRELVVVDLKMGGMNIVPAERSYRCTCTLQ
ncbi:hypothetical protein Hanom_Chr12g01161711 [Helianthus anomalus]